MFKIVFVQILVIFFSISINAKDTLYLHLPSDLPSKKVNTTFGDELLKLIDSANDEIYFAIYGIRGQDGILKALLRAKKRGVTIKGIVDSDSKNKNYYSDTHLLYKYFDIKSDHHSYIMHNKFFIVDKKVVWTGSSNISDTGTGGYNANNAVVIYNEQLSDIYIEEFEQMYYDKKFHIHKLNLTYENIKTKDSIISVYFSPKSNTYQNGIKELLQNAKKYIYIPIFYLTHKDLAYELISAHNRGVEIKIILDATAARNKYSMHKALRKSGIKVKVENFGGKMHSKSIIVDDKYFVTGSMNLTKAGNSKNDENTLIIQNEELAKKYKNWFVTLWKLIPSWYLDRDPSPESLESGLSCLDGIDNDFDHSVDIKDRGCKR